MYINFWYPIARAEEILADKPLRVNLLSLPFVAFRDAEGQARVLSDTCAAENAADTVFATGRLLEYCRENQIPAIEFGEDFAPILEYVMNKTSENGDR